MFTRTSSPTSWPSRPRASGDAMEMRPSLRSASSGPTIWKLCSSSVSTFASLTLAPNWILLPLSFERVDDLGARERLLDVT